MLERHTCTGLYDYNSLRFHKTLIIIYNTGINYMLALNLAINIVL